MRAIILIAKRELAAYLRTMSGYVIGAVMLALIGIFFVSQAMTVEARSSHVLGFFFQDAQACTAGAAVFLSMRLFAEEHQLGTLPLLYSSAVRDYQMVLGKFLAAFAFLALFLIASVYMPALILVNGKVSIGHIAAGYFGLLLMGSGVLAIGTLGSALARSQVVAVIASAAMVVVLYTLVWVSGKVEHPVNEIISGLAYYPHFSAFESGLIHLRDVVYYLTVTYLALFAATRVVEARRWR